MDASVKRHSLKDRKNDLYETPPAAVHALLKVEKLPHHIWEPACGPGSIVRVLRESGHTVWATDLVKWGCPESECGIDFLMERQSRIDFAAIVTNPPFKLAEEFVEHAVSLAPLVVMLLRLAFLESDRRQRGIFSTGHLARIWVFGKRLPMMHRHDWDGPKANSGMAFAWFVWDRNHHGKAELDWLSWEDAA